MKFVFCGNILSFFLVCFCLSNSLIFANWIETPPWMDELFGDGDFNVKSNQLLQKHLSRQAQFNTNNKNQLSGV